MLKKVLMVLGGLVALLLVLIIAIPLFIDANKFKPEIEKAVTDSLNADIELGKLSLSLWGGVNIGVEKLLLSEKGSQGKKPFFAMTDAKLRLPYTSVFSGRPDVTIIVDKPQIRVVKGADGVLNVMKLTKPVQVGGVSNSGSAGAEGSKPAEKASSGGGAAVPFDLSFRIKDGVFVFSDERAKTQTEIKAFDFDLRKFTLNKPFTFEFQSNLDIKQMKDLTLRGPMKFAGEATIIMDSEGFKKVDFKSDLDLTAILVKYASLFNKNEKVPLVISVDLSASTKDVEIRKGHLKFGDAVVDLNGTTTLPADPAGSPIVKMKIASGDFNFEKWQDIVGPFKDYKMVGSSRFDIKLDGPVSKLGFDGQASLAGFGLNVPGLVQRLSDMKAQMKFNNDTVVLKDTVLKIGNSDMSLDGSVKNFMKPVVRLNVASQLLDVDAMLPKKSPEQVKAEEQKAAQRAEQGSGAGGGVDADPGKAMAGPIDNMKKNPVMRGLDFLGQMKVKKIVVNKAELTNFDAELSFKDLVMNLGKADANAFGGAIKFSSSIDFRGAQPSYSVNGDVSGMDINAAITNQMPVAKDSLFGNMFAKFAVQGSGVNKAAAKANLKGQGNFRLEKGTFSGLAAMKAVGEKLKSIPQAGEKLGTVNISGKFRQLKSDFTIGGGRFNIVNMIADMEEANTTVNGNGYVDFDMNMQLIGKILAPAGGDVPAELKGPDGRLNLPYEVACKANSPCLKMEKAAEVVAKAYLKKEGGAQLKKAAEKAAEKIDNPQVKDLLKKLPF